MIFSTTDFEVLFIFCPLAIVFIRNINDIGFLIVRHRLRLLRKQHLIPEAVKTTSNSPVIVVVRVKLAIIYIYPFDKQ